MVSVQATFSGTIAMSNSEVQATSVKYTFTLNFIKDIPSDGKITLRFPDNFQTAFSVTSCTAVDGLSDPGSFACSYLSGVRMLSITGGFPNTIK